MLPSIQQKTVYQINLPDFLNNFKQQVVSLVVPRLLEVKAFVNSEKHSTAVNPLILVLFIFIILYVLKSIWSGLFGRRDNQSHSTVKDSPELNAEVNELKKQLKSLKNSFHQLIKEIPKSNSLPHTQKVRQIHNSHQSPNETRQLWDEVLPLYTLSLENNKKLVNYVLESQFQMLKELKKFKKAQRASLSSGRPFTSTIRSKTSDKKILKIDNSTTKSPLKTPLNTLSSIKKPEIKNSQRSIRSQIHEQVDKKNESLEFLVKQNSPNTNGAKTIISNNETITETSVKIQERIGFNKVQRTVKQKVIEQIQQEILVPSSTIVQSPTRPPYKILQASVKNHTQHTQSLVRQETFSSEPQEAIGAQQTIKIDEPFKESLHQNIESTIEEVQGSFYQQPQLQEPQVFVPVKIPVVKKLNPPKQGAKRPPPPPPKK